MNVVETIFKLALAHTMIKTPLDFILTSSKLSCMNMCLTVSWCVAVSYSKDTRNCTRADSRYMITDSINLVPSSGWQYYQMFPDLCPVNLEYVLARPPIGLCFKVYTDRQVTQSAGTSLCENDGGSLIKLDTLEKNEHIKSSLKTYTALVTATHFYIGAERASVWTWSDGSLLSYSSWGPNEPTNSNGEKCSVSARGHNYNWADIPCGRNYHFICEKLIY